ncbi:MAG: hypothetical protein UH654_03310 [Lachnospiraceae bacterium]|nr:hypothetical protein [Lachnospiraceae bacterium]MEE0959049.1 hypothetical protein [Lachnospiraceae bacterium]
MGFFDRFRKKKKYEEYKVNVDLDAILENESEIEEELEEKEVLKTPQERLEFVKSQCETVVDSGKNIENYKTEYQVVKAYLDDIYKLENLPPDHKTEVIETAQRIVDLTKSRKKYQDTQSPLEDGRYAYLSQFDDDMPKILKSYQNDEKYMLALKKDVSMLEAEKINLKYEKSDMLKRQIRIKGFSVIAMVGLTAIFIVFVIAAEKYNINVEGIFIVVLLLAAIYVAIVAIMSKKTIETLKLNELKMAKATSLQNRAKIKYINAVNNVEYQREKYGVKDARQMGEVFEQYMTMKLEKQQYQHNTSELAKTGNIFAALLKTYDLYDANIWVAQARALVEPTEMRNVKNNLISRRKKIKEQIDYNIKLTKKAKEKIFDMIKTYPDEKESIMKVINSYDDDNA